MTTLSPSSSPPRLPPPAAADTTNRSVVLLSLLNQTRPKTRSLPSLTHLQAASIHAHILKYNLHPSPTLAVRLLPLLPLSAASSLLASVPKPDILTFNLLIASSTAHPLLALRLFSNILFAGLLPDEFTLPSTLNACAALASSALARAAHAIALKLSISRDPFVASALISAYAACGFPACALQVLDETPNKDLPVWNSAISGLSRQGEHHAALRVLARMRNAGVEPNRTTLSSALPACGRQTETRLGQAIHAHALKLDDELCADVSVNSSLVYMYSKCGDLASAMSVFLSMTERNVVSWNSIIGAHARCSEEGEAWKLFGEMLAEGYEPSKVTLTSTATASRDLVEGRVVHGLVTKLGLAGEEITGAAIVDMYVRFGSLVDARTVFDEVPRSEMGSWNSIIMGYARHGHPREALNLFYKLRDHTDLSPNSITLAGALSACAALGAIGEGKGIHDYIISNRISVDLKVGTSLISMYSKCGSIAAAREVFKGMGERDVVAWNVMISAYAVNGRVREALELFDRMVKGDRIPPNETTFAAVLSACSNAKMVQEGWDYFELMKRMYKLEPTNEQYACMVDLLGRAGKLDDALAFIQTMPIEPDVSVWGALLCACKIHNNIELGDYATQKLFELDAADANKYVRSSNLYASVSKWKM